MERNQAQREALKTNVLSYKDVKYQCFGDWCCWRELNSRPLPYQGSALPLSYSSAGEGAFRHKRTGAQEHSGRFFHTPVQKIYGREENSKKWRVGAHARRSVEGRIEGEYGPSEGPGEGACGQR